MGAGQGAQEVWTLALGAGNPESRPILTSKWPKGERYAYYVEAVTNSFSYPGSASTTLEVTRGVKCVNGTYPHLKTLDELLASGELVAIKDFKNSEQYLQQNTGA